MILGARYVVPVDGPVIEGGAVIVEQGRVVFAGPVSQCATPDTDFGAAVICPGFVNAHTHLELTDLAGKVVPGDSFVDWLLRLVAHRRESPQGESQVQAAVSDGVRQSLAAGVTCVGDVTTSAAWTRDVLIGSRLRGVSFGEVIAIGRLRDELPDRLARALAGPAETPSWRWGLSPHAPYTVEAEVMRACGVHAREHAMPLAIHLAETKDEAAFTQSLDGVFSGYLKTLGVWDERVTAAACSPAELAEETGLLVDSSVIAHGNYVDDADIMRIARSGASVAYCPRTHAAFGHAPHPFRSMIAAGVNVCIGTDSLASNPSLSVLDELRFLRSHHPDLPAETLMAMGTICGATALGLLNDCGSLVPGKTADLVVVPLESGDSWDAMFTSHATPLAVYVAGRPIDDCD